MGEKEEKELIPVMRCISCDNPIILKDRIIRQSYIYTDCIYCKRKVRHMFSFLSTDEIAEFSFLSESMLLQSKLALINLQIEKAKKLLNEAQTYSEDHGLHLLAQKISEEHDMLLEQLNLWEKFKRNKAPFSDRLKLASIENILDRLKGNRAIEPPKLVDEQSMLILILNEGGVLLFSHPFTDEWKFDNDLFGGFLSAFNSIHDEIFSEGLDRVKFGNYTVLMEPIENVSVCYLFKGQTYPAKQKLTKLVERIQKDTATCQTFKDYSKKGQIADLQDIPTVNNLLMDIFEKSS
ncbi:MAG: hypothetical protein ACFFEN_03725 [Candidatus Thorarchaeota archaeon]